MASGLNGYHHTMNIQRLSFLIIFLLLHKANVAQDTLATGYAVEPEELWYLQTPVWIGFGVLLLLVLIAIFRSNSKRSKSEYKKDGITIRRIQQSKGE